VQLITTDLLGAVVHLTREDMRLLKWALEYTATLNTLTPEEQVMHDKLDRWYHLSE
jgi:hypothetical protein